MKMKNIPYPPNLNNKNEEFYGLKVEGDSMINAGINDGDTVIIKKLAQPTVEK